MSDYCRLEDDGGPLVAAIEAPDGEGHKQALLVRVGPVFDGPEGKERREPGIWIDYQEEYGQCLPAGPVLLTPAVWYQLTRAVESRLERRGKLGMPHVEPGLWHYARKCGIWRKKYWQWMGTELRERRKNRGR